ncbi:MAG: MFS transporter [Rhodospirillaceae bacterium]
MLSALSLFRLPTLRMLFVAQALFWMGQMVGITLAAIVGGQLAPHPTLATLPMTALILGALVSAQRLSGYMQRHGRRPGLCLGAVAGIIGALIAAAGVWMADFWLFSLGLFVTGIYNAAAQFYRFAAIDAAPSDKRGSAAAFTMAGAVVAALAGPTVAIWSKDVLVIPFLGAFFANAVLAALSLAILSFLTEPRPDASRGASGSASANENKNVVTKSNPEDSPHQGEEPIRGVKPASAPTYAVAATEAEAEAKAKAKAKAGSGPAPKPASPSPAAMSVTNRELLSRPGFRTAIFLTAAGHSLMVLMMTATPLAMTFCALPVVDTAMVIQWHVLGMFLPFFISGPLTDRIGSTRVGLLGLVALTASALISASGQETPYFLVGSFLLGVGWNLMMIAGTTLLGQHHSQGEKGKAQGLMEMSNVSLGSIGSFASGALLATVGWTAVNLGALVVIAVAAWLLLQVTRPAKLQAEPT